MFYIEYFLLVNRIYFHIDFKLLDFKLLDFFLNFYPLAKANGKSKYKNTVIILCLEIS